MLGLEPVVLPEARVPEGEVRVGEHRVGAVEDATLFASRWRAGQNIGFSDTPP